MSVELDDNLVDEIIGQVKTQDDLADLSRQLLKAAMERVLAAELEDHLVMTVMPALMVAQTGCYKYQMNLISCWQVSLC